MNVCSTRLKNENISIKIELIEKLENMDPDFEPNFCSRTTKGVYRVGKCSIQLIKWIDYDTFIMIDNLKD